MVVLISVQIVSLYMLLNDVCLPSHVSPDNKVHGANMGPTRVLSALGSPHVGPMNLVTRVFLSISLKVTHVLTNLE